MKARICRDIMTGTKSLWTQNYPGPAIVRCAQMRQIQVIQCNLSLSATQTFTHSLVFKLRLWQLAPMNKRIMNWILTRFNYCNSTLAGSEVQNSSASILPQSFHNWIARLIIKANCRSFLVYEIMWARLAGNRGGENKIHNFNSCRHRTDMHWELHVPVSREPVSAMVTLFCPWRFAGAAFSYISSNHSCHSMSYSFPLGDNKT